MKLKTKLEGLTFFGCASTMFFVYIGQYHLMVVAGIFTLVCFGLSYLPLETENPRSLEEELAYRKAFAEEEGRLAARQSYRGNIKNKWRID